MHRYNWVHITQTNQCAPIRLVVDHPDASRAAAEVERVRVDERLEFDRFYPPAVAFEYNGPQHDGPTDIFSAEYATKQRGRGLIKHGICATRGITLVVIRRQNLCLQTMQAKVGTLLPLRDLNGHERLVAFLERASRRHRLSAN